MLITQKKQKVKLFSSLEEDSLIFDQLEGREGVSIPYCFIIHAHSKKGVDFDTLMAKQLVVEFEYGGYKRYFGGIVGEIEQIQSRKGEETFLQNRYKIKIYPELWRLTFGCDYRIFQNLSPIDIIKQILKDQQVSQVDDKTTSCGKEVREFCVQYGETHYHFVCRLMEESGIFYSFEHTKKGEKLILWDDSSALPAVSPLSFQQTQSFSGGESFYNEILHLSLVQQVVSSQVSSSDYHFETATKKLYHKVKGGGDFGHLYQYPGLYTDSQKGEEKATHHIQSLEWARKTVKGTSTVPKFCAMNTFLVKNHPYPDANKAYILTEITHSLDMTSNEDTVLYKNDFKAFPSSITYRPPLITQRPVISSTQTAIVTGKKGEEIWCDEYGRIKVKFHWDQSKNEDEKSSCWIRVAHLWAGSGWGSVWIPRIGMEVVVTFLNGNPDQPLITGCVYNSQNLPPYIPDTPTKSALKSHSTKEGGIEGNELRFEDKKDHEEVFIHAQKDLKAVIKDNRTTDIKEGDDTYTLIAGNRATLLQGKKVDKRDQRGDDTLILTKGSRTVTLKAEGDTPGNHLLHLGKGDNTILINKGNFVITLDEGNQTMILNKGDQTLKIKGKRTIEVSEEDSLDNKGNFTQKTSGNYVLEIKGNLTLKVSGEILFEGKKDVSIHSGGTLTLKAKKDVQIKTDQGDIDLNAKGATTIKAGGEFTAQGLEATLKGKTGCQINGGPSLSLQSSGTVAVKGALINIG